MSRCTGPPRTVTRAGELVELPPRAFDLLIALLARRGAVARRHELLREVWGYDAAGGESHGGHAHGRAEEEAGGQPASPRYLLTARRVGYRLALEDHPTADQGSPPPAVSRPMAATVARRSPRCASSAASNRSRLGAVDALRQQ